MTAQVWTPEGTSRGTVLLLTGRGEHAGVYQRLGRRLATDGYTLVVPESAPEAERLATLFDAHPGGPRVLLGADTGALHAWSLALTNPGTIDALVLAGLPLESASAPVDREAELAARTSCPVHRGLLSDDAAFGWGALAEAVPDAPDRLPELPTLVLHGSDDPVAPVAPVRALAERQPTAQVALVSGGVHDVLNDQFHRSVAARLVLFLEEVGKGAVLLPPIPLAATHGAANGATNEATHGAVDGASRPLRARRAAPVHISARLDHALAAITALIAAGAAPNGTAPNGTGASATPEPVRCETIARARGFSLASLVNIMIELRRAGLVHSRRGCEGGYWLARPPEEITLADVVRAVEGEVMSVHGSDHQPGPEAWLWDRLGQTVTAFLAEWTLADVRDVATIGAAPAAQTTEVIA